MNRDSASGFGIGFLAGALVGAALGILFAPRSGKETREIIKEKAQALASKIKGHKEAVAEGEDVA